MNNPYAAFFAAYNNSVKGGNPLSREEQISQFTDGRTESLKELKPEELKALVVGLNSTSSNVSTSSNFSKVRNFRKVDEVNEKADRMRKAIISIFYKMEKPPAAAIAWAEKQGVGGEKKRFNDYTNQELYQLILVAEKILEDYLVAIRKKLSEL